jgi:hypothetical protein
VVLLLWNGLAEVQTIDDEYSSNNNDVYMSHAFSCIVYLLQECIRYNGLLSVMERSLKECIKALKGLVVMSPELERVAYSMYDNQVKN